MRFYTRKVKKFGKGEIIFSENSQCDGMYIIDKGKVRVFKTMESGAGRREIELCTLGTKAMFGEMAMIDEECRSASVQAIIPTECTIITKQIFEDQLSRIPNWMVNLIRILVQRIRDTNEKLREHIENNTKPGYDEDTGRLLMVNPDRNKAANAGIAAAGKRPAGSGILDSGRISPEEIIEDLFDD